MKTEHRLKGIGRHRKRLGASRRTAPGSAPGTLTPDPAAAETRLQAIAYGPDGIEEVPECRLSDLERLRAESKILWLDATGLADVAMIEEVGKVFGLHRLALEDVINAHQRPKSEEFDEHVFIVARMLVPGPAVDSEQVAMFVGADFLVTFQEKPGDAFDPVRIRLRAPNSRIRQQGADYLGYALLDALIDGYFPVLEAIGEQVEHLEDAVIARPEPEQVDRLHQIRRELLTLRRAIWPTRELVNALIRDQAPQFSETTRLYLRDCYDHAIQLMDIVETYREITSSLLDVYLSSQSTKMNEVMKVLTIIATIFIPLSFLAGVWGMNFNTASPWNMPELAWAFGYPAALLVMLVVALGLVYWFWRKGWIGRDRR